MSPCSKRNVKMDHPFWDGRIACPHTGETPVPQVSSVSRITPSGADLRVRRETGRLHRLKTGATKTRRLKTGATKTRRLKTGATWILGCTLSMLASGCQLAYFLTPDKGRPVKAEYTKIDTQRVAVIVWADRPTLDIDPKARRRVCDAVVYEMKKHLEKAELVPGREVEDLQERSGLDWEGMSNQELCKKLKCDVVLRIDLLEYTARGSEARELRKGRVKGTVNLYERTVGGGQDAVYQTEVTSTYPSGKEKHVTDLSDGELLREAVSQFGQSVAKKFYDHEESYHGPQRK